ncbi:MAG: hypothetical protein FJZ49_05875 [Candidatus Verstraetearchaeota archaeon]|nr:hypothetical protein [Candidatus Verstraetearchaeota archaeon]
MKCRSLRRRYVIFRSSTTVDDASVISGLGAYIEPDRQTKVVYRWWPFLVVRLDQVLLGSLREKIGQQITLRCGTADLSSVATTGSIKRARERIKTLQEKLRIGDEEAVPVKSE